MKKLIIRIKAIILILKAELVEHNYNKYKLNGNVKGLLKCTEEIQEINKRLNKLATTFVGLEWKD